MKNQFAVLSAESDVDRLAQVSPMEFVNETLSNKFHVDARPVCNIISRDEGDEDRRLEFYDVIALTGETLYSVPCTSIFQREKTYIDAATWANNNGYRIE